MSDTPRTDEQTFDIECVRGDAHLGRHVYPCGSGDYVESNFARQLERELADAHRTIESLRASVRELIFLHEGARAKDVIQRGKDLL